MPVQRDPLAERDRQRHLAALEALFSPKKPTNPPAPASRRSLAKLAKIVSVTAAPTDPQRERLVTRLLAAEGPRAVARATGELERAGFTAPEDQDASLTMLEHPDETRVRHAIAVLARLLESAPPKRRAVLDARLSRLCDLAEDAETRDAAAELRRRVLRGLS